MQKHTLLSLIIALLFFNFSVTAQCRKEKKDYRWEISAGAGALPTFLKDRTATRFVPVSIALERKLNKCISLGIYSGYSVATSGKLAPGQEPMVHFKHSFFSAGLRLSAHVSPDLDPWDVYGGFQTGWFRNRVEVMDGDATWFFEHKGLKPSRSGFLFSGFLGVRYALTKKTGVFAEAGWSQSLLTFGANFRL